MLLTKTKLFQKKSYQDNKGLWDVETGLLLAYERSYTRIKNPIILLEVPKPVLPKKEVKKRIKEYILTKISKDYFDRLYLKSDYTPDNRSKYHVFIYHKQSLLGTLEFRQDLNPIRNDKLWEDLVKLRVSLIPKEFKEVSNYLTITQHELIYKWLKKRLYKIDEYSLSLEVDEINVKVTILIDGELLTQTLEVTDNVDGVLNEDLIPFTPERVEISKAVDKWLEYNMKQPYSANIIEIERDKVYVLVGTRIDLVYQELTLINSGNSYRVQGNLNYKLR